MPSPSPLLDSLGSATALVPVTGTSAANLAVPGLLTQSDTLAVPANAVALQIFLMVGGGGAGGGLLSSGGGGGGGGASGTWLQDQTFPVLPGDTVTVTIGAGASAGLNGTSATGANAPTAGGNAGATSLSFTSGPVRAVVCAPGLSGGPGSALLGGYGGGSSFGGQVAGTTGVGASGSGHSSGVGIARMAASGGAGGGPGALGGASGTVSLGAGVGGAVGSSATATIGGAGGGGRSPFGMCRGGSAGIPVASSDYGAGGAGAGFGSPAQAGMPGAIWAAWVVQSGFTSFATSLVNSVVNGVWANAERTLTDKSNFGLSDAQHNQIAQAVELHLLNELDGQAVLKAVTDKIAACNPSLAGLTASVIAEAVRAVVRADLERADGPLALLPSVKTKADVLPSAFPANFALLFIDGGGYLSLPASVSGAMTTALSSAATATTNAAEQAASAAQSAAVAANAAHIAATVQSGGDFSALLAQMEGNENREALRMFIRFMQNYFLGNIH